MTQPSRSGAPAPVQGVTGGPGLNSGNAAIDPGSGNIVFTPPGNAVEIKKAPSAFNVYEYFNSNTDNVRLAMQTAVGGPEFIGIQAAPTSVVRDLIVSATGNLLIQTGGATHWTVNSGNGSFIHSTVSAFLLAGIINIPLGASIAWPYSGTNADSIGFDASHRLSIFINTVGGVPGAATGSIPVLINGVAHSIAFT